MASSSNSSNSSISELSDIVRLIESDDDKQRESDGDKQQTKNCTRFASGGEDVHTSAAPLTPAAGGDNSSDCASSSNSSNSSDDDKQQSKNCTRFASDFEDVHNGVGGAASRLHHGSLIRAADLEAAGAWHDLIAWDELDQIGTYNERLALVLECSLAGDSRLDEIQDDLAHNLAERGFVMEDVPREGNCFLQALQLVCPDAAGMSISALRQRLVRELMTVHASQLDPQVSARLEAFVCPTTRQRGARAYFQYMLKNGRWCDELMVFAASRVFGQPVVVVSSLPGGGPFQGQGPVVFGEHLGGAPLVVGHMHEYHYVAGVYAPAEAAAL
jgi:hypothetical protein